MKDNSEKQSSFLNISMLDKQRKQWLDLKSPCFVIHATSETKKQHVVKLLYVGVFWFFFALGGEGRCKSSIFSQQFTAFKMSTL